MNHANPYRTRFAAPLLAAALALTPLLTPTPAAAESVKIFTGAPPAAQQLADMMFPQRAPRTRSIVFTNSRPAVKAPTERPEGFGFLINFELNSSEIMPNSRPYLDQVGEMLKLEQARDERIVIEGHTDASGPESYNLNLSERRALAVKSYLVSRHDIEPERLVTFGKGESEPLPERGARDPLNRRVQFQRAYP